MDSIVGILKKDWWQLLKENHFNLHPTATPRALILFIYSFNNSRNHQREIQKFGQQIEQTQITQPPLFILGHWRSGTTFLQNLLSHDPQFYSPNIFECRNPHTFLVRYHLFEQRLQKFPQITRPTDNVQIRIDSPGEEEFAVGVMSLMTPLLGWVFPKNRDYYEKFLTFEGIGEQQINHWKTHYLHFLKKIVFKHQKQLLLKSPVNTARLRLLHQIFPDAYYVHIHRHPFEVFQSSLKMYATAVARSSFQGKNNRNIEDDIIAHYKRMHQAYFKERSLIPKDRLLEIGFSTLEREPLKTLRHIYDYFGFNFNRVEIRFKKYLESQQNYAKNKHQPLPKTIKDRLVNEWHLSFKNWHYEDL